jgi:hypothetical protein
LFVLVGEECSIDARDIMGQDRLKPNKGFISRERLSGIRQEPKIRQIKLPEIRQNGHKNASDLKCSLAPAVQLLPV